MINDGGAAFPISHDPSPRAYSAEPGMSLRAYFAARVFPFCVWNNPPHEAAKLAVSYADALIAELNKP